MAPNRYYTVFNLAQIDGIEDSSQAEDLEVIDFTPITRCEEIASGMPKPPVIESKAQRAYYQPSTDVVNVPLPSSFEAAEHYYATLFHELVHSTGHESRLARPGVTGVTMFGSHDYSKEELVAEMGAAFLCGEAGIEGATIDSHAAYVGGWLKKLKDDSRLVITAAAQAQKAADLILGTTFEEETEERE